MPERLRGRVAPIGEVGARLAPIFRDRDELPTADDLGEAVQEALQQSATLIVICSPAAARSRWVNEEVAHFKRLGRSRRVFAFIVAGEPNAKDPARECFPPALRFEVGAEGVLPEQPVELIAADAREQGDGRHDAFVRLIAGMLGVGFDDLRQRELHRRHRRMTWIAIASTAGMSIMMGLTVLAMRARNDAQRRQENSELVMAQMLEDLESRLKKADQLEALDDAAKKVMVYFKSLDPRDLTDRSNTQQAKLFTQIGQIYLAQLHYDVAVESFTAALNRAAALVARHPRSGEMLFERAQAEYWIGDVYYLQGKYAATGQWWITYRDSGVALARLDPSNPKWQREAVSGLHNLAALELRRGNLAAARDGFLGERAGHEKLLALMPTDAELQASIANVDSYLGSLAERVGDYPEAVARFGAQISRLEAQVRADPRSARMRRRLANALGLQSEVMAVAGQLPAAVEQRRQSLEILTALASQDAANRELHASALNAHLKHAILLRAQRAAAPADQIVQECRLAVEQLAKSASPNRGITTSLATAWRLEAQRRESAGESGAIEAVTKALSAGKALHALDRADEANLYVYATTCVVAGILARRAEQVEAARQHWQTGLDAIGPRLRESNHWWVLDPAARALALLGRSDESRALIERLQRFGYQPLEPWP